MWCGGSRGDTTWLWETANSIKINPEPPMPSPSTLAFHGMGWPGCHLSITLPWNAPDCLKCSAVLPMLLLFWVMTWSINRIVGFPWKTQPLTVNSPTQQTIKDALIGQAGKCFYFPSNELLVVGGQSGMWRKNHIPSSICVHKLRCVWMQFQSKNSHLYLSEGEVWNKYTWLLLEERESSLFVKDVP